jgi:hypothetical protein
MNKSEKSAFFFFSPATDLLDGDYRSPNARRIDLPEHVRSQDYDGLSARYP